MGAVSWKRYCRAMRFRRYDVAVFATVSGGRNGDAVGLDWLIARSWEPGGRRLGGKIKINRTIGRTERQKTGSDRLAAQAAWRVHG